VGAGFFFLAGAGVGTLAGLIFSAGGGGTRLGGSRTTYAKEKVLGEKTR